MEPLAPASLPHHHRHFRIGLLVSLLVIIALGLIWYSGRSKAPLTNTANANIVVASTIAAPQEFTDFVGEITSIDPATQHISVMFGLAEIDGKTTAKTYDVTVGTSTTLKTQTINSSGDTLSGLEFSGLKKGQRIHVFAKENLYPLTAVTPTTIYLVITK